MFCFFLKSFIKIDADILAAQANGVCDAILAGDLSAAGLLGELSINPSDVRTCGVSCHCLLFGALEIGKMIFDLSNFQVAAPTKYLKT